MKQADRNKVVLVRLTTKFGCWRTEFHSIDDAIRDAEDRSGLAERGSFAWGIYSADEQICLAWGVVPSKDVLKDYRCVNFIGERLKEAEGPAGTCGV